MIRIDNLESDYSRSGAGAQEERMQNRELLEDEILHLVHKAEERVLEMVYYILVG